MIESAHYPLTPNLSSGSRPPNPSLVWALQDPCTWERKKKKTWMKNRRMDSRRKGCEHPHFVHESTKREWEAENNLQGCMTIKRNTLSLPLVFMGKFFPRKQLLSYPIMVGPCNDSFCSNLRTTACWAQLSPTLLSWGYPYEAGHPDSSGKCQWWREEHPEMTRWINLPHAGL